MNKKANSLLYFLFFISLFVVDGLTKLWALANLQNKDITLINGLNLALVWNRGVSWGLFSMRSFWGYHLLTAFIFIVIILFLIHTYYTFQKGKNIIFEVLILGGAFSNLSDRILYSGVIDFIDCYISTWHWPTFNFADVFVVIGVFGIIGRYLHNVYYEQD